MLTVTSSQVLEGIFGKYFMDEALQIFFSSILYPMLFPSFFIYYLLDEFGIHIYLPT